MGRLVYSMIASLDGYAADEQGRFDWAMPDEEVHRFANELERGTGTLLYGRRMYETMAVWDTPEMTQGVPPYIQEYAEIWRAADKIVYSRTLDAVTSARTRIEREFDPEVVARMKRESERDISIGGPTLAASAMAAGLVDEYQLFVVPTVVGGGLSVFPQHFRATLELVDERRFASGVVYLRYVADSRHG